MINGLLILLLFQWLGESITRYWSLPIPGPVIGMMLLLFALLFKQGLAQYVERTANTLIKHLTLLFFPAGVGIAMQPELLGNHWLGIITSVVVGTILSMILTALLLKALLSLPAWRNKRSQDAS